MFRRIARPMLAAVFISSGVDALRNPEPRAELATGMVHAAAERFGTPDDPMLAARLNGGVMVAGGLGLATGAVPRLSAAALAASLVPTTVAGHAFWEKPKEERSGHLTQFLKNLGLLAGLLLTVDTPRERERAGRRARKVAKGELAARDLHKAGAKAEKKAHAKLKEANANEAKAAKALIRAERAEAKLARKLSDA